MKKRQLLNKEKVNAEGDAAVEFGHGVVLFPFGTATSGPKIFRALLASPN
jgi:hypothetical protein